MVMQYCELALTQFCLKRFHRNVGYFQLVIPIAIATSELHQTKLAPQFRLCLSVCFDCVSCGKPRPRQIMQAVYASYQ